MDDPKAAAAANGPAAPKVKLPTTILWDFENALVPSGISGLVIARRLHDIFGQSSAIKSVQAFGNSAMGTPRLLEELALAGIKFVEVKKTPNRKDVADKMILTEMFLFAMDNPPPATIILISGDIDFANALSALKFRGYRIVLVRSHTPSRLLLQIPDEVVHWGHIVQPLDVIDDNQLRISSELHAMKIPTSNSAIAAPSGAGNIASSISHPSTPSNALAHAPAPHHGPAFISHPAPSPSALPSAYRPSPSNQYRPKIHVHSAVDANGVGVTVEDLLDVCLSFAEENRSRVLASQAGIRLKEKYPRGFYKGCMKELIEAAEKEGWLTTEGSGGYYTLVLDLDAMTEAWDKLKPVEHNSGEMEEEEEEEEIPKIPIKPNPAILPATPAQLATSSAVPTSSSPYRPPTASKPAPSNSEGYDSEEIA